jgi:hypothetical protein
MPGKSNNEWYVLEVLHSLKVLVRISGEGNDERYDELEAMLPSKIEAVSPGTTSVNIKT